MDDLELLGAIHLSGVGCGEVAAGSPPLQIEVGVHVRYDEPAYSNVTVRMSVGDGSYYTHLTPLKARALAMMLLDAAREVREIHVQPREDG